MLYPLVCENGSPVPSTPGNDKRRGKRKPFVRHTPGAALLTDAANVYVLSKYSEALVADIETKSFHEAFGKGRTYQKLCVTRLAPGPLDLLLPQHMPTCTCGHTLIRAHNVCRHVVCPRSCRVQGGGIDTPPIMDSGIFFAERLIVLMQLQVVGFGTRAVPMLVDTGSPNCYIADIALQNFGGPTPYLDEHANIEIAGKRFRAVVIKPGAVENDRLLGLNILGMDAINAICGAGPSSSFQEAFAEAFNGNGQLPVAKVPRLTGPTAPAAPAPDFVVEQLTKLAALKDAGQLDADEFKTAKAHVLALARAP